MSLLYVESRQGHFVDSLLMWCLLSLAPTPYHLLSTLTESIQ